jgi:glycosyltransferase involved in cell wall biosynthesis
MFSFFRKQNRTRSGIDIVGYLSSQSGVGQAGRLLIDALNSVNYPLATFDVKRDFGIHLDWPANQEKLTSHRLLMAIDAHSFENALSNIPKFSRGRKHVISQWFWELEQVPAYYLDALKLIDELWVPSRYMYETFLAVAPHNVDVRHMPLPLVNSSAEPLFQRDYFSLDKNFVFLFIFDFLSVMKRKNPLGIVEAFCNAFEDGDGPVLVIKTANGDLRPHEARELKSKIAGRTDIRLFEQQMTTHEMTSLLFVCNAYVSLHRAEGLGLTLAEAMSFGKPVIATAYSGNLDFMSPENSILIPWSRVKVGPGAEGYDSNATWAEPNLEMCTAEMKRLVASPELCQKIGANAKRSIAENYSCEATGSRMAQRLEQV